VHKRTRRDADLARAALEAAVRAHHELLDAQERFDQAMWAARSAGVSVRQLADAVAMSKSQVSRRYKRAFRRYLSEPDAHDFAAQIARLAEIAPDPPPQPGLTPDPKDDYLVALARAAGAHWLVAGDPHLTGLTDPPATGPHP